MRDIKKKLPKIMLLDLGGTIISLGQTKTSEYYSESELDIATILHDIPELATIAEVQHELILRKLSHQLEASDWLVLARRIETLFEKEKFSGIVISQGTNTLEETTYFLNLIIRSAKPIVLTGAIKPANALSADGPANLYSAITVAAHPDSCNKGVLVVFNDEIHAARDVVKNTFITGATFNSNDAGPLGYIQGSKPYFYRIPNRKHTIKSELALPLSVTHLNLNKIHIFYGCIDNSPVLLNGVTVENTLGIIIAGMGKGYQTQAVIKILASLRKKGIIIVRSSRQLNGIVTRDEKLDDEYDFVVADNLNSHKARILLAVALARKISVNEIQRLFYEY